MNTDNLSIINKIVNIINRGNSGVILVPENCSVDTAAASTALYLGLLKLNKNINLVSAKPITYNLTAVDKFQQLLASGGNQLVVSFPYQEGSIDKVDYNIKNNNFNLVIVPREGFKKINPQEVEFSYTGNQLDFFIVIDAVNLNQLGPIYLENKNQFQGKEIINIDRHLTNNRFGTINYLDSSISSSSELIMKLLARLNLELDKEMATNLYAGISAATNNFSSYTVNATTFEKAALLLKKGARKKIIKSKPRINQPFFSSSREVRPINQVEKTPLTREKKPPQDWLKPKIFKGGGLI